MNTRRRRRGTFFLSSQGIRVYLIRAGSGTTTGCGARVRGERHANDIAAAGHLTNSKALLGHGRLVDERLNVVSLLTCRDAASKKHIVFKVSGTQPLNTANTIM